MRTRRKLGVKKTNEVKKGPSSRQTKANETGLSGTTFFYIGGLGCRCDWTRIITTTLAYLSMLLSSSTPRGTCQQYNDRDKHVPRHIMGWLTFEVNTDREIPGHGEGLGWGNLSIGT